MPGIPGGGARLLILSALTSGGQLNFMTGEGLAGRDPPTYLN